MPYFLNIG